MPSKNKLKLYIPLIIALVIAAAAFAVVIGRKIKTDEVRDFLKDYLETYYSDQKVIDITSADEKELNEFVFKQALYNSAVNKPALIDGKYCLTRDEIDQNLNEIFHATYFALSADYDYIPAQYIDGSFVLDDYTPEHKYVYVISKVKYSDGMNYSATISYIDTLGEIRTYDCDGNEILFDDIFPQLASAQTDEKIADLSKEIKDNPYRYERYDFSFRYLKNYYTDFDKCEDVIVYLGCHKIENN